MPEPARFANSEGYSRQGGGRAIAFASKRKGGNGIYIASTDGKGDAVLIKKGSATSLDWGPTPKQ